MSAREWVSHSNNYIKSRTQMTNLRAQINDSRAQIKQLKQDSTPPCSQRAASSTTLAV